MRTVILLAALLLGDAIAGKDSGWISDGVIKFIAIVMLVTVIMDILEFIKKMLTSNE